MSIPKHVIIAARRDAARQMLQTLTYHNQQNQSREMKWSHISDHEARQMVEHIAEGRK